MRRVILTSIVILLGIAGVYFWNHRAEYGVLRSWLPTRATEGVILPGSGKALDWRPVSQPNLGFRLEMPADPKRTTVQASNEAGANEPVNMLIARPDADHTYAIAWADQPPVARLNDLVPDKTLDQARDGALARTGTTLVNETRTTPQGYPGRDVVSHNLGGGILDTRFVYAGVRLYMLIAASPSPAGRHEDEVMHFFNSFALSSSKEIPETLPPASR